jgi:hypothetical protein
MSFGENSSKPLLIEPGVKYFLDNTLKQCHIFKTNYNNIMLNIGLFAIFILILGTVLLFKYKGKLTPTEKKQKDNQKKQYILSKIKNYNDAKKMAQQELISGLPHW